MDNNIRKAMNANKKTKIHIVETEAGTYIIRLIDFYPGHKGEQQFEEVSKELLDYLIAEKRRENREFRQDWLHISKFPFDEILMGEMDGIIEQGADEVMMNNIRKKALFEAFKKLDTVLQRRLFMHYFQEKSKKEISDIEGISRSAVTQSINAGIEQLREIIKIRDII